MAGKADPSGVGEKTPEKARVRLLAAETIEKSTAAGDADATTAASRLRRDNSLAQLDLPWGIRYGFKRRSKARFLPMKNNTRRWLGWTLGAVVLALILLHISRSPQWQGFEWGRLWSLLIHVNPGLLLLSIALNLATLLIRAVRWKFFVDPIKKCSPWVLFNAQALGFSSIYLVGRAGEVVRPAYIAKAEDLPFTSQLAVWAIERVYDGICLVILFALALYFEPVRASSAHGAALLSKMHEAALGILVLSVCIVACLVVYRAYSGRILERLGRGLKRIPAALRNHLLSFLRSFSTGLDVLRDPWDFSASVLCSV
ncbi:MAG: lysylphosphatidylglycerol synthase transmembrane domain-containing protein, partial [Terriglobia bacterium]